jgi:hypothetical protein
VKCLVKCSEGLSNRVSNIIRRYIDHMKSWLHFLLCVYIYICIYIWLCFVCFCLIV